MEYAATPPPRPWGLTLMAPYPPSVPRPYARVELDADTQTGCYRDPSGRPLQAGKHGSNAEVQSPYETPIGGDGNGPQGTKTDTSTDWVSD